MQLRMLLKKIKFFFEMIKLFDKSYELPFKAPDETDPFKDFAVTNGIINFMGVRWNSTSKLARCVKVFQAAVGFVAFIRWVKTIIKNVYYIYISPIDPNLKFEAMDITTPGTEMWEFTEEKHSGFDFGIWNNKKIKKLVLKGEGKKKFEALVKEFEAKGKSKKGRGTQRDKNGEKRKWRTHVKRNWIDYDKFNDDNSDFFVGTYDEDGEKILVNVKDFGGLSTLDPNQVAIYQMDKNGNFIDMLPLNDFITSYHSDNEDDNAPDYDAKDYEAKSDKSPLNGFVKKRWPKKEDKAEIKKSDVVVSKNIHPLMRLSVRSLTNALSKCTGRDPYVPPDVNMTINERKRKLISFLDQAECKFNIDKDTGYISFAEQDNKVKKESLTSMKSVPLKTEKKKRR